MVGCELEMLVRRLVAAALALQRGGPEFRLHVLSESWLDIVANLHFQLYKYQIGYPQGKLISKTGQISQLQVHQEILLQ